MFDAAKTNKIPIPKCNTVSLLQEKSQRFLPSSGIPASAQDSSSCDTHPSPSVQYWAAFMAAVTLKAGSHCSLAGHTHFHVNQNKSFIPPLPSHRTPSLTKYTEI
ncbi:hypothetical protein MRB53_027030 [Persea americana]|uniref:Uncharacterized protein n=1 Tax=Persea americana TaxID=3435 RepID=A0ACC2LJX3_PERAE|nr:hypothetical protein MRB53_027030 [Persea americana]